MNVETASAIFIVASAIIIIGLLLPYSRNETDKIKIIGVFENTQ